MLFYRLRPEKTKMSRNRLGSPEREIGPVETGPVADMKALGAPTGSRPFLTQEAERRHHTIG